jgi:FAD-dependent urate hydroxylase
VASGDDKRAFVAGGGVAGLAAALALRRRGVPVTVLEQQPELREMQAAIQIWINGVIALRKLGLGEQFDRISRGVHVYRFVSWRGSTIFELAVRDLAAAHGAPPPAMVRRPDLLAMLVEAVGEGVRWGANCVGYEQDADGVVVRLSDGSEERGALVLGADGLDSPVRRQLAPDAAPRFAGYQYLRALTRFDDVPDHEFTFAFGRGSRFLFHELGGGSVYWAGIVVTEPGTGDPPEGRKAQLLEEFRAFPAPIPALIEATDERGIYRTDIRDLVPGSPWVDGRVALIGDAAHAMTPNQGRASGEALVDALAFARCVADAGGIDGDVPGALAAYEAERRDAAGAVQNQAARAGRLASWSNPVACAVREQLMRRIASRALKREIERSSSATPA